MAHAVFSTNSEIQKRIASSITNVDLHDISRLAKAYGVKLFFVVTPLKDQQRFAERILRHWIKGFGASYNPYRKDAIELVTIAPSLEESLEKIVEMEGEKPLLIATAASNQAERSIQYSSAKGIIDSDRPVFLIFGTAWGLDRSVIHQADYVLDPIKGRTDYNHLSVRSAAAIILDRLIDNDP